VQEMAKKATELLLKSFRGKDVQLPSTMLSSSLIMRASTGPVGD
jgi:LacI family transcriptional regulator